MLPVKDAEPPRTANLSQPSPDAYRHPWLLALGSTTLATLLTWVIVTYQLRLNPVLSYLLAVMACAFWGGYLSGLLATAISVFAVPYLFVPGFNLAIVDWVRLISFTILSLVISWIRQRQLRAEALLRETNEELEQRVRERTHLLSEEISERKRAQLALEASEQRFRALVEQSADGFALLDENGALTYIGHAILGHDAQGMIGTNILDLVHPQDRENAASLLHSIRDQPGAVVTGEVRVRDRQGAFRWVEGAAKNALTVPAVGGVILTYRDVTARRAAELAHRERARQLQLALDAGRMGAWDWDIAEGRLEWSEQLLNIYGVNADSFAITPDAATAFVYSEDRERLSKAVRHAIENGAPLHEEFRIVRTDNECRWVLAQGQTFYDESRRPIRMVGVMADVHERKVGAEAAAKLAAIVEYSDDSVASYDLSGMIQTWNRSAERLYGYAAEEIIGRSVALLLPSERQEELSTILDALRSGRPVQRMDAVQVRKDGARIQVSLTASPIRDHLGNVIAVSYVSRDITQQKRLEEQVRQKQKLESLGVLSGGIAHDFNNLLVGIMGNASLVLESMRDDDPNKPILEDVLMASTRSADLTRQLLAYAGKGRFETRRADLSEVAQQTARLVQSSLPKGVELQLSVASGLPAVLIDPVQIQQVVMNLVINGAEAIGSEAPGIVRVKTGSQILDETYLRSAAFEAEVPPGEYVYVDVSDTGCGMDEATRARIFDPFFTTKFTGRGLGLAAVLGIVRGHHGALQVYSELGRGTTFKVFLPIAEGVPEPLREPAASTIRAGSGTVLVIDDEEVVRRMASAALERMGYRVLLAEHGGRALDLHRAEKDRIRLVILDWTMPVLDGHATLSELRRLSPEVPVLLSSGFSETEALSYFNGLGVSGFLQKPYTAAQLAEKVHAVVTA